MSKSSITITSGFFVWFSEIAVGNFTDETTVPGYPIEFFPDNHRDSHAYEDMTLGGGLDESVTLAYYCGWFMFN